MPAVIRADTDLFNSDDYRGISNGSTVFVVTSALGKFVHYVSGRNVRFVLITGAGVIGVPNEISDLNRINWRAFMRTHVTKWYTQNYDLDHTHPNVYSLPLGINFHSLTEAKGAHEWGLPRNECVQDRELQKIASAAPSHRDSRVFVPRMARMHRYGNDREIAYKALHPKSTFLSFQRSPMRRNELWSEMSRHRFVVSPLGMGMDCHRTWEALALGCIPIVRRSTLVHSLFKGLPVVAVDAWSDVNESTIRVWHRKMHNITPEAIKRYAKMDFWLKRIVT